MKKYAIVILCLTTAVSVFAQTKTVTNKDLEKFRLERLESERKLKELYAEKGTTTEEVEKQYRQKRAEMEQYSDQLRRERIETENIIAQANALSRQSNNAGGQVVYPYFGYGYGSVPYIIFSPFGNGRFGHHSLLSKISKLPPNMRLVQEYALMYPNIGSVFNPRVKHFRGFGKFGFGKFGNVGNRSFISVRTGGFGTRVGFGFRSGGFGGGGRRR